MTDRASGLVRQFALCLRPPEAGTDADLLARFAAGRDGEAFAELVRRHGPMVRGVGRRIVRDPHAADDVFQATFLVLARRAGGVRDPARLANWLYGVAVRTALEAKRAAAVRRVKEAEAAAHREWVTNTPEPDAPDVRAVLDAELVRLPDVYRTAIVLCDLEGLPRADAARRLGWTEGTLSGRLARARALLGRRLAKSGLATVLAAGLTPTAAEGVPAALLDTITRAAVLVAAGHGAAGVVPAAVLELTRGVRTVMLMSKLKVLVAGTMVAAAAAGTGTADRWSTVSASPQPPPATPTVVPKATPPATPEAPTAIPPKAAPSDADRIAQLERERDELMKKLDELQGRLAVIEKREIIARQREAEARRQADAARKETATARAATEVPLGEYIAPPAPAPAPTSALPLPVPTGEATAILPPVEPQLTTPRIATPSPRAPQPTPELEPIPTPATFVPSPSAVPAGAVTPPAPSAYALPTPSAKSRSAKSFVIRTYPVGDLLGGDSAAPPSPFPPVGPADQLIELVRSMVDPEAWPADGQGAIVFFAAKKVLVVRQTNEAHKQIATVLELLRAEPDGPRISPPAPDAVPSPAPQLKPTAQPKPKGSGTPAKPKKPAPTTPTVPDGERQ